MTHPIEEESYRRLHALVDLSHLSAGKQAVVARVIHATADLEFARTLDMTESAVEAGVAALAAGAPVVVDVEMVRAGLVGLEARCYLGEARAAPPALPTLSARAMQLAAQHHPEGAVFVVGCAPTALEELINLVEAGRVRPALVIGVPVGFVGAAEAKEHLRRTEGLPAISNVGERGGSAVAAAIVNALRRLVGEETEELL